MSVKVIKSEEFEQEVLQFQGEVLVDFFAEWCGPCKMIAPVLDKIADSAVIKVIKVNVDEDSKLAAVYQVMSIPTMLLFDNGEVKNKHVGAASEKEIMRFIGK